VVLADAVYGLFGSASISYTAHPGPCTTSRRPPRGAAASLHSSSFYLGQASSGGLGYGLPWRPEPSIFIAPRLCSQWVSCVRVCCGIRHGSIDAGRAAPGMHDPSQTPLCIGRPNPHDCPIRPGVPRRTRSEIKPIEPVWSFQRREPTVASNLHALPKSRTSPSSAPASSVWVSPGGWRYGARRFRIRPPAGGRRRNPRRCRDAAACAEASRARKPLVELGVQVRRAGPHSRRNCCSVRHRRGAATRGTLVVA